MYSDVKNYVSNYAVSSAVKSFYYLIIVVIIILVFVFLRYAIRIVNNYVILFYVQLKDLTFITFYSAVKNYVVKYMCII